MVVVVVVAVEEEVWKKRRWQECAIVREAGAQTKSTF